MRRLVGSSGSDASPLLPQSGGRKVYLSTPESGSHLGSNDDLTSLEDDGASSKDSTAPVNRGLRQFWTSSQRHLETWTKFLHRSHLGYHRIMDRSSTFYQSFGRWNIKRVREGVGGLKELYEQDQFHTIVNMDTRNILAILLLGYIFIVTGFAAAYLAIGLLDGCNLGISNLREAYYFSLETMTTVGYGTMDVFFGGCWSMLFVITAQACVGLLIDAALIGIIFARLSRPQTRAATVVFSRNAVIRRVRGEFYLMFQVGELRKHQLLDAHVRCYVIRHDRMLPPAKVPPGVDPDLYRKGQGPDTVYFQTHYMRLQHPDDELGSSMLLVVPQLVVHRIDAWSPMMPPPRWMSAQGVVQWGLHGDADYVKAPWEKAAVSSAGPTIGRSPGAAALVDSRAAAAAESRAAAADSGAIGEAGKAGTLGSMGGQPFWDARDLPTGAGADDDAGGDPAAGGDGGAAEQAAAAPPASRSLFKRQSSYWECEFQQFLPELTAANAGGAAAAGDPSPGSGVNDASVPLAARAKELEAAERGPGYVYRFPDLLKRWDDVDGDRGTWYERMKRRVMAMEHARREQAEEEAKRKEAERRDHQHERERRHKERQQQRQQGAGAAASSSMPPLPPQAQQQRAATNAAALAASGGGSLGNSGRRGARRVNTRRSIMQVPTASHPTWGHYGRASSLDEAKEPPGFAPLSEGASPPVGFSTSGAATSGRLERVGGDGDDERAAVPRRTSKLFSSLRSSITAGNGSDRDSSGRPRAHTQSDAELEGERKKLQQAIPNAFEPLTGGDKDRARELFGSSVTVALDGEDEGGAGAHTSEEESEEEEGRLMDPHVWFGREEKNAITAYMVDREVEIICIIEGIDTSTGSTVQSRHSYAFVDMVWDHAFDQCVLRDREGACVVDFNKFHDIRPCPPDCLDFGFVQSFA